VIIFGSVQFLLKKSNQTEIKKKNQTETDSNRPVSVRFFGQKPVQTSLARFFSVWIGFGLGLVRFGFFSFRLIKLKPNQSVFSKF